MKLEILDEARDELSEAIGYYEEIEPGLGIRLKEEARRVLSWIQKNPLLPRLRPRGYRRVNFRGFEYMDFRTKSGMSSGACMIV